MWAVARRPRWIGALILALGIAAGFAALGQWQLARSIESATVVERETETVVDLESVADPSRPVETAAAGQLVRIEGALVPGDFIIISERVNGGATGFWVTGHLLTEDGASLAVALGWTADEAAATAAATDLNDDAGQQKLDGRFLPSEAPQGTEFEDGKLRSMSVAALINLWADAPDAVYEGYLVSGAAPAGTEPIDSPVPSGEVTLNWLNLFYAAEWVVFAGFAVFLWYRLVKDAWERETSEEHQPDDHRIEA